MKNLDYFIKNGHDIGIIFYPKLKQKRKWLLRIEKPPYRSEELLELLDEEDDPNCFIEYWGNSLEDVLNYEWRKL